MISILHTCLQAQGPKLYLASEFSPAAASANLALNRVDKGNRLIGPTAQD